MSQYTEKDLENALWAAADAMRAKMTADVYKDYLLGLIFYKNLSDKILYKAVDLLEDRVPGSVEEAQAIYKAAEGSEDWDDLVEEIKSDFGCCIHPDYTFAAFFEQINNDTFLLENLHQGFHDVELSQGKTYENLFEGFDVNSKDLGKTPQERNLLISSVIKALAEIDFTKYGNDALGDAYEYLIGKFASESGKKAGEFYTPQAVSKLIAKIVTYGKEHKEAFTVYDPCCGSGSLLLQVRNFLDDRCSKKVYYHGQDSINQTYNLARMNMMLHKVPSHYQRLNTGDTLAADWPDQEPTNFDAVVMNPPYSQKWEPNDNLITDPRFRNYERLAPKSAADYAFLLHGFHHLKTDGTMGIVLPHGVLFRSGAEGVIRKHLIRDGSIYAVIGLPANIFYNTGIPTCVLILKKNNTNRDVLFIDASKDYQKQKARNLLTQENLDKIFNAFKERQDIEKYSHLATFEEIEKNDFNLNIPRYVDSSDEEAPIDLDATYKEFDEICKEEVTLNNTLNEYFKELGLTFRMEV